ncbi:adenine phosphoribosyltransferase [Pseudactinotalea sp. Z1739]|uniref:adenine phosphoribosyltransferase n=1 Tax=Pseudactinotalea sp. Z1739 TaxID=3413028 RepID=UPI003C7D0C4A
MSPDALAASIRAGLRQVPDYPEPGVLFRDITPLLADAKAFGSVIQAFAGFFDGQVDVVAGIEARGFLLAAPLAAVLGTGVLAVRKAGKLPPPVHQQRYDLEYGSAELEVSGVGIRSGQRVALLDDVLATGGTARAAAQLLERIGARVEGIAVLLELAELGGRGNLTDWPVHALLTD